MSASFGTNSHAFNLTRLAVDLLRVFRIWGVLEMAFGRFQDRETARPSGGLGAISRSAKDIFKIRRKT